MVTPRYSIASPAIPFAALRHPFIDRFGQFAHAEWPEKVHDEREFAQDLARELAELPPAPDSWDEYGGWRDGPLLTATGAFRTERIDGRWHLVTPSGHLFFSFGVDTLRHQTDVSNGNRHPDWYETVPPKNGAMSFTHWNLQRKFGRSDYLSAYYGFIHRRLAGWGFNTIGRWGAWCLPAAGRTPYLLQLESPAKAPRLPGTHIYDVFHPDFGNRFRSGVAEQAHKEPAIADAAADPFCLGLSIDNELPVNIMLTVMMAQDFRASPAKNAFLERIRAKYPTLASINDAWGTKLATWPELMSLQIPVPGAGFATDAEEFRLEWLRRYFRTAREAIKGIAPERLYFAAAFAGMEHPVSAWDAAAEAADVLVADIHGRDCSSLAPLCSPAAPERPLLVGAFTFGCRDRGMFAAGPVPLPSQLARAEALRTFARGALGNPFVIGCHWFQYRDQPLIGRDDGEAFEIGLVDVCDRPYPDVIAAAREIGENLYSKP